MYENTTNLVWHGGNLEPHYSTIEIFASPNGILTKCNDNGGYFKRQAVKRAWERKEFFPEKHTGELNGPEYKTTENIIDPGIGTGIFYNWSDFIYVDTDTGTLYLGIDTQNEIFFPKEPKNNTKLSRAEFKLDRKELEEQRHPS